MFDIVHISVKSLLSLCSFTKLYFGNKTRRRSHIVLADRCMFNINIFFLITIKATTTVVIGSWKFTIMVYIIILQLLYYLNHTIIFINIIYYFRSYNSNNNNTFLQYSYYASRI